MSDPVPLAGNLAEARIIVLLKDRIREFEAALTPSNETKAAYMGEFSLDFPEVDVGGNEVIMRRINVPWTTIKEIMAYILAYAREQQQRTPDRGDEHDSGN